VFGVSTGLNSLECGGLAPLWYRSGLSK